MITENQIPTNMSLEIANILSANRCENCGIRYRAAGKKWCARCIEIYNRRTKNKFEAANMFAGAVGERYIEANLSHLEPELRDQLLSAPDDIFLWGPVGVGKTYAMATLIRKFIIDGFECHRINFDDFCCRLRSSMNFNSKETEYSLIEKLTKTDKLFIDDLGLRSKSESDFAYQTFYNILNKRQERLFPTYLTSNKDVDTIGRQFDYRIASRLKAGAIIFMDGPDRRNDG